MDGSTLNAFKSLSDAARKTLVELCIVYPETENILKDVVRATKLQTIIEYKNLAADFDRIVLSVNSNPHFVQLQSKDICVELLRTLLMIGEFEQMLNHVDYIIFQRVKIPVLCLETKNDSVKVGVSVFIELTEVRIKVHRMVDRQFPTSSLHVLGIVSALALATYAALK